MAQPTSIDRALPGEVYDAYSAITTLARSINVPVQSPEIVFIGKKGAGKSVTIEAILGHRFFDNGPTLRPVMIKMVNDKTLEVPDITFHADAASGKEESRSVPLAAVADAHKERNVASQEPMRVTYRHRHTWDMTIVETPGLLSRGDEPEAMAAAERLALGLASRAAIIVSVEPAAEWDRARESLDLVRRADPKLERSVFVFNKFAPVIKNFMSAGELRAYLSAAPLTSVQGRLFFTTGPGDTGRPADNQPLYRKRIQALAKGDVEALEALQYDRRYEKNVGAPAVQRAVVELAWKRHQGLVSDILRRMRELNREATESRDSVAQQIESLTAGDLRSRASAHASALLRAVADLLSGSLEGRPAQHGQTLAEERQLAAELGDWFDAKHERIELGASSIPSHDCRLYGAQQFERLLAEFRAVVAASAKAEVSSDEAATALGVGRPDATPNVAWAASDLAQGRSKSALTPLVAQLVERAKYIAKRLIDIAQGIVARHEPKQAGGSSQPVSPFFSCHVRDLYCDYVDELAEKTLAKCLDEFYCSRLVYWDLTSTQAELIEKARSGASATDAVRSLSETLFAAIKQRVVDNVLLKCYEGLLVPLQRDVAVQIHGRIAATAEAELEEMFELSALRAALAEKRKYWEAILSQYQEQEAAFLKAAAAFAHHA